MDINIEEFSYADFLQLPDKERIKYSIIDLLDEKGNVWYDKPPAPRIKVVKLKLFPNTSRENLYLDFYNLDAENREACYEFIIQYSIAYVEKKIYDESKAPIFTVNDLLSYHDLYKIHLDFLRQEGSAEKLVRDTEQLIEGGGGMVDPTSPYLSYAYINKHLERCHLKLELSGNKKAFDCNHHECEDFLALCYFQLVDKVINQKELLDKCIICKRLFKKDRSNHVYCSPKCRQVTDSKEKSKQADKIHQKLCELINEWMGPKQESDWMSALRLSEDLSEMFSIGWGYKNDLDSENISEGVRWQFTDNGISLSENATIKREGSKWLITDENETYIVKKEKGGLNIIRKTFLLDKSPAHSLGSFLNKPEFKDKLKEEKKIIIQPRKVRKHKEYKFIRM